MYGADPVPITEESPVGVGISNPYGRTKYMMEQVLTDLSTADKEWRVILLRYFRNLTQEKAARVLGVSQVQVSRIERRAMESLRRKLEE